MRDGDEAIREQAASWYFRQDAGPLTSDEEAAFRRWIADPAHRAIYDEVAETWSHLGAIPRPVMRSAPPRRPARRWAPAAMALAATLAIAVIVDSWWRHPPAEITTAVGEVREIVLADGSRMQLNTGSAADIRYDGSERRIRLVGGEALFTVAKDARRPFVVETVAGSVKALGTVFAVRLNAAEGVVTVLESRVEISPEAMAQDRAAISEGQQARFTQRRIEAIETVDAEQATAWRRGKLVFVDRPLGQVVDELNRYYPGLIRIVDPAIRKQMVSGVFDTKSPLRALDAMQASLGLRSTRLTNYLVLLHR